MVTRDRPLAHNLLCIFKCVRLDVPQTPASRLQQPAERFRLHDALEEHEIASEELDMRRSRQQLGQRFDVVLQKRRHIVTVGPRQHLSDVVNGCQQRLLLQPRGAASRSVPDGRRAFYQTAGCRRLVLIKLSLFLEGKPKDGLKYIVV